MNILDFHVKERGVADLARRVGTLVNRFGVSSARMDRALERYLEITDGHSCTPTFPVTTVAMKRNPSTVQKLRDRGAELAVHGYVHTDYAALDLDEQKRHQQMATQVFQQHEIPFTGFRCPYYRWNEDTWQVAADDGFSYSSNRVAHWDALDEADFEPARWASYEKAIDLYSSRPADSTVLLPYFVQGMVEVPVSMPDDEAMVERLKITSSEDKARIWCNILDGTYSRGEIFTLSLHPERIYHCQEALDSVLSRARDMSPAVWVASMNEVAEWWREKEQFSMTGTETGPGRFAIDADISSRGTVVARGVTANRGVAGNLDGYKVVEASSFEVESPVRPFIGVPPDAPESMLDLLKSEGHIVEASPDRQAYGVYLESTDVTEEPAKRAVIDRIESSDAPLVRLWRWPDATRSCFSVTGDIDSVTLVDFFMRPFEV